VSVEIPLTRGLVAVVDAEDVERVLAAGKWQALVGDHTTYAQRNVYEQGQRRTVLLHTFLTGWPRVDHRDGNGLNNRRSNLRPATARQNMQNRRIQSNNTSGYKGVGRQWNRWRATIQIDGRQVHLGTFGDPADAARAYDAAAREHFGEFARLNFPEVCEERPCPG
jgi:hypothetical protein